jgi:hypothetical protein
LFSCRVNGGLLHAHLLELNSLRTPWAIVGTAVGAVIAVTQEAIGWIHANLGPGGTIGVLSGVAVFVVAAALGAGVGVVLIL